MNKKEKELVRELLKDTEELIKAYKKSIRFYKFLGVITIFVWFWLGYWYGTNGMLLIGLFVMSIIAIMHIFSELSTIKMEKKYGEKQIRKRSCF